MPIDEAKKLGAMALFNEKYGDTVRVIGIGAPDAQNLSQAFSREFCGGTHVNNTGKIVGLKIVKEESISAGVRRITALTGSGLLDYYAQRSEVVEQLEQLLKTKSQELPVRVTKLIDEIKNLQAVKSRTSFKRHKLPRQGASAYGQRRKDRCRNNML
jgi:alanyl-tRNA synthetase